MKHFLHHFDKLNKQTLHYYTHRDTVCKFKVISKTKLFEFKRNIRLSYKTEKVFLLIKLYDYQIQKDTFVNLPIQT